MSTRCPAACAALLSALVAIACTGLQASPAKERKPMLLEIPSAAQFRFTGPMGDRIAANVDNWLLRAPLANPGLIEMFRVRDRQPVPDLVPWAGEFIGKYLISAIQACRMTDDRRLKPFVAETIAEFIATQAEDGYLGPFRKDERLLGHWDLWGHYHAMLALLMWYQDTGDQKALDCAIKAADLVCNTFLDTKKRVWDADSHEMNMAIIHSLGRLYRITANERYLRMMREIEQDWQRPPAGDYLRSALAGLDFYRTPKPRWESLHDLQGLVELYRITGDDQYRRAFVQHWTSIRNYDRHPDGGFTTGEQAIGNPYSEGAIETCCTIAWMAISVDMLRLTGDPTVADELELATWNGMLGAQHPSGRWWTYDTPLDGVRAASAHTIVFQSRFGTPELNCCSANAPRGLGMLSEWGVLLGAEGPVVSYYGPGEVSLKLADGTPLTIRQETHYPADGTVKISLHLPHETETTVRLRIPAWSQQTTVKVAGKLVEGVRPGAYLPIKRHWRDGDVIELSLEMSLRTWAGELGRQGTAVLYRGPLLMSFDQRFNALDTAEAPELDAAHVQASMAKPSGRFAPIALLQTKSADGREVTLCDFATAGAFGTHYRSWLPMRGLAPAAFHLKSPVNGESVAPLPIQFEWTGYRPASATGRTFKLEVAEDEAFSRPVAVHEGLKTTKLVVHEGLAPGKTYWWRVTAANANGATPNALGAAWFTVDAALPNRVVEEPAAPPAGPDGLMVAAPLAGDAKPTYGALETATDIAPAADHSGAAGRAVDLNGTTSKITYQIGSFPEDGYTASIWVCPDAFTADRLQEVVSAWAVPMDDPLRIVLQGDEVFARIEAHSGFSTAGVKLQQGKWVHLAAVKDAARLLLYVNGELSGQCAAPTLIFSAAHNIGVGTNPNYTGNERLIGKLSGFAFYARALTAEQIGRVYRTGKP